MRFLIRTRAMSRPFPRTSPRFGLRQIDPAVEGRIHHGRARHGRKERKKERKQNAERRNFTNLRTPTFILPVRGRTKEGARRAPSGTRTPSGVPLWLLSKGLTHPKDSASDQASRSAAPVSGGVIPPAPAPVTASTSRAGHGAGRHDVRCRPGAKATSPCPRAPQPAPPDGVTGRRPCKKAGWAFLARHAARDQEIPPAQSISLI
jgi:hypothetical protein